ncbi:class I SAM-dependent methyltransferase [Candidatus Nomurabacteria bacterium]|nr:class I SAM-dependent methyltransferase [Candidatus Nomurabacteria bacterium]
MKNQKLIDFATNPEQYSTGEATSWIDDENRQKEQRERFWNAIKDFIPSHCNSVFDIGCGSGWLAEFLFKLGVKKYEGIEPSLRNYNIAKEKNSNLQIFRNSLEDSDLESTFDCVVAIMMLSHLKDVDNSFRKIYELLNDNGIFIVVLSAFHEEYDRYQRNGRTYEVEIIDEDQYVDRSVNNTSYGIADINRRPEYYIKKANEAGLSLLKYTKIEDIGYSPKDLLVFKKS